MIGKDWYEWENQAAFDAWHQNKIQELNLPRPSVNQGTNETEWDAQHTIAYTIGHEVQGKIIAIVEDEHAIGLIKTLLRLPDFHAPQS